MAGKGKGKKDSKGGVIIKRYDIVEGGHHGGAWKVAYADFVTAMMAFFLLMWLLNATTEDQRKGLADYFSPNNLMSHASSGTGQPFGGHTAFDQGALVSDRGTVDVTVGKRPVVENTADGDDPVSTNYYRARNGEGVGQGPMQDDQDADDETDDKTVGEAGTRRLHGPGGAADTAAQTRDKTGKLRGVPGGGKQADGQADADVANAKPDATKQAEAAAAATRAEKARQEKVAFVAAAEQIKAAVQSDPSLAELGNQLAIDVTPQGLRVQILDEVKLPMFASGSAAPNDRVRLLVQKVVPILTKLNRPISIAGHTDAAPFPGPDRTNWELSAERANATRRMLTDDGFPDARILSVSGHADREPLLPADPLAAANRRIAILVLRDGASADSPARPATRSATPAVATRR